MFDPNQPGYPGNYWNPRYPARLPFKDELGGGGGGNRNNGGDGDGCGCFFIVILVVLFLIIRRCS